MFDVRTINLEETIDALRKADAEGAKELKRGIREVAKPTLSKMRGYAAGLGSNPTGAYAGSIKLKTRSNGVAFTTSDPGGGVIEFANIGAVILTGKRKGQRCPVPHGSTPPRAMLRAVLEDEREMVRDLNELIDSMLDRVIGA